MNLQLQTHAQAMADAIGVKYAAPVWVSPGGATVEWRYDDGTVYFAITHAFDQVKITANGLPIATLSNLLARDVLAATAVAIFGSEMAE